ncbi:uncharacterized protein LOC114541219 [Dendronephthya gigantea]|uniref:uncharacterized protein LOC114541219 n=1 Tax=Dendronephthya gigantea TaxID=151771 RepID=UPI001069182A|nr:uncharacterized protein LOC114541219 [Dendronephthya gigantea]
MAPSKKQKMLKDEKKLLAKEKSKKAHAARVLGTGSQMNFTTVNFSGSALVEGSKRTLIGLALAVAFLVTGHGYDKFSRMRGKVDVIDEDLFAGTSKSMEGCPAKECYKEAKDEGCNVEVVWQDGDSSAANAISKINHFCCLQQCDKSEEYARRLIALGTYHSKDIHTRVDGKSCGFHPDIVCSCGDCDEDEKIGCSGVTYKTKYPLTCAFHKLAYQIECLHCADDAKSVIHPTMVRGCSNQCEAHFSVLPDFHAKDQNLCRLHYITSTNCGLSQGNMSLGFKTGGPKYHWLIDLYDRIHLPVIPAVIETLQKEVTARMKEVTTRMKEVDRGKTEGKKKGRICIKVARAENQEERKKWLKHQELHHSYGTNDADEGVEEDEVDPNLIAGARKGIKGAGQKCGTLTLESVNSC